MTFAIIDVMTHQKVLAMAERLAAVGVLEVPAEDLPDGGIATVHLLGEVFHISVRATVGDVAVRASGKVTLESEPGEVTQAVERFPPRYRDVIRDKLFKLTRTRIDVVQEAADDIRAQADEILEGL